MVVAGRAAEPFPAGERNDPILEELVGRSILAVILGYLAMAVFVIVSLTVAFLVLGVSRVYQEGSWEVSTTWITASIVLGFAAAVIGGQVCARIAPRPKPLFVLIGIVIVAGLAMAPGNVGHEDPGPRGEEVSVTEVMANSRQPDWVDWLNPSIGAIGLFRGGARARRAQRA